MSYQRDEHVICWLRCYNPKTGKLFDPTVSVEIRIKKLDGTPVVGWVDMTKDTTVDRGVYYYAYATSLNAANETYTGEFKVTNSVDNLITIKTGTFVVEDL